MSLTKNHHKVKDLAIFTGKPLFPNPVHVGRPNIGTQEAFLNRVKDIFDRVWLTNEGPYLRQFEERIAEIVGVKHCIVVTNATVGLEILLRVLVDTQGEIIVPSMTFIATAHAAEWLGHSAVFCDIDPTNYNLDPVKVEELITPKTRAILGVHLWGRPCNISALEAVARRHNIPLIFDAAHAFACSYKDVMIGSFGQAEVFSFHATKFCNSLEGGAIVTNDDRLSSELRLAQNFGFSGLDKVVSLGTNGKMNEVSAAMGLTSLESMDSFIDTNRHNYHQYQEQIAGIPGIKLIEYDHSQRCNYQYIIVEIDEDITGVSRDRLAEIFWAENVLARRYFHPGCHRTEPYLRKYPDAGRRLPVTEQLSERLLALPTGTSVGEAEIRSICKLLRLSVQHSDLLSAKWPIDRLRQLDIGTSSTVV